MSRNLDDNTITYPLSVLAEGGAVTCNECTSHRCQDDEKQCPCDCHITCPHDSHIGQCWQCCEEAMDELPLARAVVEGARRHMGLSREDLAEIHRLPESERKYIPEVTLALAAYDAAKGEP